MTAVNPATVVTFAAVVLGRSAGDGSFDWATVVLFAVGAFAASATWQLVLARPACSLLGRLLTGPARAALHLGLLGRYHARVSQSRCWCAEEPYRRHRWIAVQKKSPSSCSVAASSTQVARPSIGRASSGRERRGDPDGAVAGVVAVRERAPAGSARCRPPSPSRHPGAVPSGTSRLMK